MRKRGLLAALMAVAVFGAVAHPAGAVLPATGVISSKNMTWTFNWEQLVGSDIEFLERGAGATLKRYAIVGSMGNGFNIIDITNPALPIPAGVYTGSAGAHWQSDVQVNPRRNIVVVGTDLPGSQAHGFTGTGIELVDITNLTQPTRLSSVSGLQAHNATIIDDKYIYTNHSGQSSGTHVIDYTNASAPVDKGARSIICGNHDLTVDANNPTRAYSACAGTSWQILDITDPLNPKQISKTTVTGAGQFSLAHQSDPSTDSSFVAVTDERGGGLGANPCPGGGIHLYDISGKYVANASEKIPKKMGVWFAPFTGAANDPNQSRQWGNCTSHNLTFQAERQLMTVAWYTAGTFVMDLSRDNDTTNDPIAEYGSANGGGPTTWGKSWGNFLPEGAETWSSKWSRFDDPLFDRYVFTSDMTRGFDVLNYSGPMSKKIARLRLNATAPGGTVTGKLDRYAVWTATGWVNKPLAGQSVTVSAGAASATVTTGADGSFSAPLGLGAGAHAVTATWAGDANYDPSTTTSQVTV